MISLRRLGAGKLHGRRALHHCREEGGANQHGGRPFLTRLSEVYGYEKTLTPNV